jgi:multidrug efflux pump subunit AcrB
MIVELPEKTTLDQAREAAEAITARLKRRPEVKRVFAIGGGQGAFADVRKVRFVVNLVPRADRQNSQKVIAAGIIEELNGIEGYNAWSVNETTGQRDLRLAVLGDDGEKVADAARRIRDEAKDVRLARHIRTTAPAERQDIDMALNREAAEEQGITAADIFETIRIATVGDASNEIPLAGKTGIKIPVRISIVPPEDMQQQAAAAQGAQNMDANLLGELWITGKDGSAVKLYQVADISLKQGPVSIARRDGKRVVMVEADLAEGASLGQALDEIKNLPAAKSLPVGVRIAEVGDAETMRETFESFSIAISLGIAAVLAILIVLFRSILQPITILASLPLSVGGAILALLLFDKPMDMPVIIGFLMLMGIVTKNAIMLVDFAITHLEAGMDRTEAVLDAGRKRARPIIMTTVAMIAGMTPSALGLGAGGEFRSPMAIAVIGGLVMSTLLSLIFVPALFTVMDDLGRRLRRTFGNVIKFRELP